MFVARDKCGALVDADAASRETEYVCPMCRGKVRLRRGAVNAAHFAHDSLKDCDDFTSDISYWHLEWQKQFPLECREVVVEHNGEQHRADVLIKGHVIEFQHSSISCEEFNRRNAFYTGAGYKVVWVFDMTGEFSMGKMVPYNTTIYGNDLYHWKHPMRIFRDYLPQEREKVFLFFQVTPSDFSEETEKEKCYIEQVVWAIADECGCSNFKRFCTELNRGSPVTKTELMECIKQGTLY